MVDKHVVVTGSLAKDLILDEHHKCKQASMAKQYDQVIAIVDAFSDFVGRSNLMSRRLLEMRVMRAKAVAASISASAAIDELERISAAYAAVGIPLRIKADMTLCSLIWRFVELSTGGRKARVAR